MNSDHANDIQVQQSPGAAPGSELRDEMKQYRLPEQLDELEWVAQHVFVPRIEAIMEAMLDEHGTVTVKRADTNDSSGIVFTDVVFGRKDAPKGRWTAFLIRVELDPRSNLVCIQAGEHPQMNRQFAFAEKGWNSQLIEGFEWVLSDSMRQHLRIRGGGETPSAGIQRRIPGTSKTIGPGE